MSNVKDVKIIARYNCFLARTDNSSEYETIAMQLGIMRMNPILGIDFEVKEIDGFDCELEISGTEAVSGSFLDFLISNISAFAKIETYSVFDVENNIKIC